MIDVWSSRPTSNPAISSEVEPAEATPGVEERGEATHDPVTVLRRMLNTPPVKRKRQD